MNRIQIPLAAFFGALMPLVFDSALKGAALLALAALTALAMWRASAAARHLVWLVAIVALLVVPVLSVALPQWHVLPKWAAVSVVEPMSVAPKEAMDWTEQARREISPIKAAEVVSLDNSTPSANSSPTTASPVVAQVPTGDSPLPTASEPAPTWRDWLPLAWCAGFTLLALRLLAAHLLLRHASRKCMELASPPDEKIAAAFSTALTQLALRQRVKLLLDDQRTIPVVWGVFRPRLMLPVEARAWSDEQLRSVFLHELAHIKRRDPLVQWLTQIACALHWWNPLVWLAAWRLHVERERACDDLVLASGVRPSAYAEHLLHVATKFSPARWTSACGLAMARKSSLEGRMRAVLSEKLNRRGVTSVLAVIALLFGTAIAVPVAMLRAEEKGWNSPRGAHIGSNDFSVFCIHDGKDAEFIIAYHGDINSTSRSSSNAKSRTWTNDVTLTAKQPGIALTFHRTHLAPGKLSITTAPAEGRDLSEPAPREFGQKEYDLAKGRVFLLSDTGLVRQLDIATPLVIDQPSAKELAALIAASSTPEHKEARALYEIWQRHARANGDIPGALIGELAAEVKTFIDGIPRWEPVPTKLDEIRLRLDALRDWKPTDAIALLDEVAAAQDSPITTAASKGAMRTIRKGDSLPDRYVNVTWGAAHPDGLRAAWVLEPNASEHLIGAALGSRLLVHNAGQVPVMLQVPTWHHGWVDASDANGTEVQVSGIEWTTLAQLFPCRLGPGECIEIRAPGIGIGPSAGMEDWFGGSEWGRRSEYIGQRAGMRPLPSPRVGSNVQTKAGDELTLTHSPVPLDGSEVGEQNQDRHVTGPQWWQAHINAHLSRELPLPADAAERTHLLDRAVRALFATAPTPEETAVFIEDGTPGALDALVKRLAARRDVISFSGKLEPAPVKFRVLAANPDSAKAARTANSPGSYMLSDGVHLLVRQLTEGADPKLKNHATIAFQSSDPYVASPNNPYEIRLPDGLASYAFAWDRASGKLWLVTEGNVRSYDFTNPAQVRETGFEPGGLLKLPEHLRERLKHLGGPVQTEARELFETWKRTANDDGTIPGTFIGMLASEVRAYIKANPNLDSGIRLSQLLPRFITWRNWTQAEAIELLDDVAHHSTAPIAARVAKAKLPSGPLWRTMVEFEDIPVRIAHCSEAKDGLRIGMRVVKADWRIGGKAHVELWLHNSGGKDITFKSTGPDRQDVGVAVSAIDAEGREHRADNGNVLILAIPMDCTLPAGHVAMVKKIEITFAGPNSDEKAWSTPRFRGLEPGTYQLKCKWVDADPAHSKAGDWTGELAAPAHAFTLAAVGHVLVAIAKDGSISLEGKAVTLEQLKVEAARHAGRQFMVQAQGDLPYSKVMEVVEALRLVGVVELAFRAEN